MPSTCKTCNKVVRSKKALEEHQKCHAAVWFSCGECGKVYGKRKNLNQHVRSKHSNEFFECGHCPFKSGRKYVLQKHILTYHVPQCTLNKSKQKRKEKKAYPVRKYVKKENVPLAEKFECTKCKKVFTLKKNLTRHETFHHGGDIRSRLHECAHCSKGFRDKNYLRKHIQICATKFQQDQFSAKETFFTCLIPRCEIALNNQHAMLEHYKKVHNVALHYETLEFDSKQKFDEWRIELQRSTTCQFSVSKVWKSSTSSNWRMHCHRTGRQPAEKENRERFLKSSGSKKLNGFCPAEIVLKESKADKTCHATIQKTHVGHCNNSYEELKFLSLDKEEKSNIACKLSQIMPLNCILLNYQSSIPTGQLVKQNETMNYDISNIVTVPELDIKNLPPSTQSADNPPQNVPSFIDEHQQSILFYKAENSDDTEFGVLKKNDFALVFMTQFQENLLKKFGNNVITYNATRKINPNDFILHSIMVVDDDWEGIAVAFLLSNRNDVTVLELFLHSIKRRIGVLTPQTVMTDMQTSFHYAFQVVMQVPKFSLWCSWHVYEQWRKNQKKIKNSEKRKCVLMTLYELSRITNVQLFQTKLEIFINDTDPDLQPFIQYFKTKYATNGSYWAYCYRIGAQINKKRINESFYSFLKGKIFGRKKIRTLSECLQCIEMYISIKENGSVMKIVSSQRMEKIRILRSRHHTAVKSEGLLTIDSFPQGRSGCSHTWLISSNEKEEKKRKKKTVKENDHSECSVVEEFCDDDGEEHTEEENRLQLYIVQRDIDFIKQKVSHIECSMCKVALEEYSCTCIDYLIKCNLCKHIHAVAIYCKKNGCQCTCRSECGSTVEDVPNMEIVSLYINVDDEDFSNVDPLEDSCNQEDSIENLQSQLIERITDTNDEETLKNVLQYISSEKKPSHLKEEKF